MSSALEQTRILVVGASRGLGRGIATALAGAGANVLAIGRSRGALDDLAATANIEVQAGDAADPNFIGHVLASHDPDGLVLVAGAQPVLKPLSAYSWEAFSQNWNVDVKATFHWVQDALNRPLKPGARIVVFSSGAALHGSPLSGGYAGSKNTQRFICKYAAGEAQAKGLDLTFQCILPQLNPNTELGAAAVKAYANMVGEDPEAYVAKRFGDAPLTPETAGQSILKLLTDPELKTHPELLLLGGGLRPLPGK